MLEDFFFDLFRTRIPLPEIIGRLSLAVVFGAAIGIDREFRQKAAGLRTHILVALAAAMFTVIAFEIFFRSEEHTSELQSLMRISYAVFCSKKKKHTTQPSHNTQRITHKYNSKDTTRLTAP